MNGETRNDRINQLKSSESFALGIADAAAPNSGPQPVRPLKASDGLVVQRWR